MAKFEIRADDENFVRRAVTAYFKHNEHANPPQPNKSLSEIEAVGGKAYVVLRNINGVLAVYRIRNDGMLKGLRRWGGLACSLCMKYAVTARRTKFSARCNVRRGTPASSANPF